MKQKIIPTTQEEFIKIADNLLEKYNNGIKLDPFELEFFCTARKFGSQANYPECSEYRFRDFYFRKLYHYKVPPGLELTFKQHDELERMAVEWYDNVVTVLNHSNLTLQFVAKETRDEIKRMSASFKINGVLFKNGQYESKLQRILWMSRFIHFKIVYDFFLGFKTKEIWLKSPFGDVVFNDYSLAHILTRHYAAGEKQYLPEQSFFNEDVQIRSLPRLVGLVLGRIGQESIVIKQPINKAITFKYKSEYYQLYLNKAVIQRKGYKGNISVLRVESLFPINDNAILIKLMECKAHAASKQMIIYEQ